MRAFAGAAALVFAQAYGYAEREKKIPNTVDTPFLLGSTNKLFTGLAIGQLVEQGELSDDDPVSKFVPDYPDAESAKRIKIKHLLSHTSGLDSFNPSFSFPPDRTINVQAVLDIAGKHPIKFEPGTRWACSNTGMLVLGRVIEIVSGQGYYDYVRKNVYLRGGMTRDPFPDYARDRVAMAQPYEIEWDGTRLNDVNKMAITARRGGPAGGGIASARDLINLANAMNAGRIVKPETLRLHASAKPDLGSPMYGYGFGLRFARRPLAGHGGNALGQCTQFGALTDTPYTIVVLSNIAEGRKPCPRPRPPGLSHQPAFASSIGWASSTCSGNQSEVWHARTFVRVRGFSDAPDGGAVRRRRRARVACCPTGPGGPARADAC